MVNTNIIEQNQFHRVWVPLMLTLLWLAGLVLAFEGTAFTIFPADFSSKVPSVWLDIFSIFVLMAFSVVVLITDLIRTYPQQAFTDKRIHCLYVLFLVIFIFATICMVILSVEPTSSIMIGMVILFGAALQFLYAYVPNNLDKYLVLYNPPIESSGKPLTEVPLT